MRQQIGESDRLRGRATVQGEEPVMPGPTAPPTWPACANHDDEHPAL